MAAHATSDDLMSQTSILKVSRNVICLAIVRGCHLNENKPEFRADNGEGRNNRRAIPFLRELKGNQGKAR
jgi:hypothetical protein